MESRAEVRLGVLVLDSDQGFESELARLVPEEAVVYTTRMRSYERSVVSERGHPDAIAEAIALLPTGSELDAIVYGCTSGSVVLGAETIERQIGRAAPGVPCVTPIGAAVRAFTALGVGEVSVLSPYERDLNRQLVDALERAGVTVDEVHEFPLRSASDIASVGAAFFEHAARHIAERAVSCLFIPCNALRVVGSIDRIEAIIGAPVVTSTQAVVWDALRACGHGSLLPRVGFGRLLGDTDSDE